MHSLTLRRVRARCSVGVARCRRSCTDVIESESDVTAFHIPDQLMLSVTAAHRPRDLLLNPQQDWIYRLGGPRDQGFARDFTISLP